MVLVYFNVYEESTYYYLSSFDSSKFVGESNKFGDVLVGLFLVDELEHKLIAYRSSFSAELNYNIKYDRLKNERRVE